MIDLKGVAGLFRRGSSRGGTAEISSRALPDIPKNIIKGSEDVSEQPKAAAHKEAPQEASLDTGAAAEPPQSLPRLRQEELKQEEKHAMPTKEEQVTSNLRTCPQEAFSRPQPQPAEIRHVMQNYSHRDYRMPSAFNLNPGESQLPESFFSDLLTHLKKEEGLLENKSISSHSLLSRNLLDEMKDFWTDRKHNIAKIRHESRVEEDLLTCLDELRQLESEWQQYEILLNETRQNMQQKEREIEEKITGLNNMLRRYSFEKKVSPKHYFYLSNSGIIRNLSELVKGLKGMDDATFNHHVTDERNDFSTWIKDVMGDERLASRISGKLERQRMIHLLESERGL
ncbi:hypothetical protein COT48_01885 [Candidatus Woesearchaeota archaeon CG08_land_8_20_14_0_20_47_9]|nr:MAG: hypothetical protein AUJ69_01300 [Candidatus Woesearchaeota archaeon CG1_02_47_18]PIO04156.1 MAG: hypothetical protein COT48_01885 [Candidatus Woesearchaeota archaeon CG08_land_8_20_14_0_20_47_9]